MRQNGIVTKTVTKVREGFAAAGRRQKGTRRWYTHPHLASPRTRYVSPTVRPEGWSVHNAHLDSPASASNFSSVVFLGALRERYDDGHAY